MKKSTNYSQVIKQTREEKIKMYMKLPKKKLAEMLEEYNRIIDEYNKITKIRYNKITKTR